MPPKAAKKDVKSLMKGVVVKKKPAAKPSTPSGAGSGADTPTFSGASKSGTGSATASGAATPVGDGSGGKRTLATANEVRNNQTVGAAGMTALGKRLVQASPSPSPEPDDDVQAEKRAKVDP